MNYRVWTGIVFWAAAAMADGVINGPPEWTWGSFLQFMAGYWFCFAILNVRAKSRIGKWLFPERP